MANLSAFGGAQPITPGGLVELGYSEITSTVTISSTSFSSPNLVISGPTVVCDGSPVMIEFSGRTYVAQDTMYFSLYRDGAELKRYWASRATGTGISNYETITALFRDTPSAGSHTYSLYAHNATSTTNAVFVGAGSPNPFLRVSKIVQQNDGLKPFWTPPLVTQLPTNPTVGDTVIYAADATNGVYWNLYYDGIGSYPWKYVGGSGIHSASGSYPGLQGTGSYADVTSGATVTAPLDGDYLVGFSGKADISNPTFGFLNNIAVMTATVAPSDAKAAGISGQYTGSGYVRQQFYRESKLSGVTASETIKMQIKQAVGSVQAVIHYTSMTVTPVRVAA
jgi:hypothetical protein